MTFSSAARSKFNFNMNNIRFYLCHPGTYRLQTSIGGSEAAGRAMKVFGACEAHRGVPIVSCTVYPHVTTIPGHRTVKTVYVFIAEWPDLCHLPKLEVHCHAFRVANTLLTTRKVLLIQPWTYVNENTASVSALRTTMLHLTAVLFIFTLYRAQRAQALSLICK